jgi:hypothetical protein
MSLIVLLLSNANIADMAMVRISAVTEKKVNILRRKLTGGLTV